MNTNFFGKKTMWDYVVSALHLPHRETKAEQLWHGFLRVLLSLALIGFGYLLGLLTKLSS